MSERANILRRIRQALQLSAPRPGGHGVNRSASEFSQDPPDYRPFLPATPDGFDGCAAQFAANAVELRAEFHRVASWPEAEKLLREIRDREGWKRVAVSVGGIAEQAGAALGLPVCRIDGQHSPRECEQCDAGITGCDSLVAQTGTVVVTSRTGGGRALSVLPPHHVVLARKEQLVRSLPDALCQLQTAYGGDYPSMISFITGPSRTGDIERILVLGAHGPKKLTIICQG